MSLAIQVWFVDFPWWGWAIAAVAVVIAAWVLFVWWEERGLMKSIEEGEEERSEEGSAISYPYYFEVENVRNLAGELKLELPTARQVTQGKRLSLNFKGLGGEGSKSETEEFVESISLPALAKAIEKSVWEGENPRPETDVTDAPAVSDQGVLAAAIEQLQGSVGQTSESAELLAQVQEAYSNQRIDAMAERKRDELKNVGKGNRYIVMRGMFGLAGAGTDGGGPTLKLTHLNPTPGFVSPDGKRHEEGNVEPDLIPVPDGFGVQVALPDVTALNAAGKERIHRGQPMYVGIIAHSPSFDKGTGVLTCAAWAIWGEPTPDWSERMHRSHYSYPYG
jgi:hypothetical protein